LQVVREVPVERTVEKIVYMEKPEGRVSRNDTVYGEV
jgi:hypothetical protein